MKHTIPIFNFHLIGDKKKIVEKDYMLLFSIKEYDIFKRISSEDTYVIYDELRTNCYRILRYTGKAFENDIRNYALFYENLYLFKQKKS